MIQTRETAASMAIRTPGRAASAARLVSAVYVFSTKDFVLESGRALPQHIAKVRIPPAWQDVRVSMNADARLWATGIDAKGRAQRLYNPAFRADQDLRKFAHIQKLERRFEAVVTRNRRNIAAKDAQVSDSASALALILHTGIRPGTDRDTGAEKQAYGATTLLGRHVRKNGAELAFTGKKGVDLTIKVTSPELRTMLAQRAKRAGRTGLLFSETTDARLRAYAKSIGANAKPKDFRTLLANRIAKAEVGKYSPRNEKEVKRAMRAVATTVSEFLGNTPAIALKSYINPTVFEGWTK